MNGEADVPSGVVVQRGLGYDEFKIGTTYLHAPGRTISEADNAWFSTMTMNMQALHVDATFAASSEFGERLVNSLLTMSIVVGLSATHLTQGTLVANLGFSEISFPAPVRLGETIHAETQVTEVRDSKSRPGQGIVTFRHTGRVADDKVVVRLSRSALMRAHRD